MGALYLPLGVASHMFTMFTMFTMFRSDWDREFRLSHGINTHQTRGRLFDTVFFFCFCFFFCACMFVRHRNTQQQKKKKQNKKKTTTQLRILSVTCVSSENLS
jgi:hypothetical protein